MTKKTTENFCNLHNHSTFSTLDGYSQPEEMVERAVELNQSALAITEHGNLFSAVQHKQACEKAGIKPIIGSEFYCTPWGKQAIWRPEKGQGRQNQHLLVLAYNQTGYQNLLRLTELANQKENFYYSPRIDYNMLAKYNEGLIVTSGCMASGVCSALNPETGVTGKDYRIVNEIFDFMIDVFGRDRYFIELQGHDIPALREINLELSRINQRYDFDYIATNDSHYPRPEDNIGQVDSMCVGLKCNRDNPIDFVKNTFVGKRYYMPSLVDMKSLDYGFDIPDSAFSNTMRIADMVERIYLGYEPEVKQYRFPIMPEYEESYDGHLHSIAMSGFRELYDINNSDAADRIIYELETIANLGFSSYFLCVYDISRFCIEENIPMTVRGSAGGSIVLYCLGVTDFCPLEYDLIFERFLNPDRISAPDADLDVDPNRRAEVIKYLIKKYGKDYTAQVVSFNYIKGRGAIRHATRIMDEEYATGDVLANKITDHSDATIGSTLDCDSKFHNPDFIETDIEQEILEVALRLEGQVQSIGLHASAVMVSNRPLREDYPLVKPKSTSKAITKMLVGLDYKTAEVLGGIKLDILGVNAIGIIYRAIELINQRHGTKYLFENIPVDDPASYDLMNSGNLAEIFQSSGHTGRISNKVIQPKTVQDVMVVHAICRPGPNAYQNLYADRMHGKQETVYKHPDFESVLKDTYGIMLYQESVMRVSQVMAGFTNGQADILRKSISKKEGFESIKELFITGAKKKGHSDEFIEEIWADMAEFNGYGFNMAHSCAYARVAVKQAYLKAKYPLEFYAAALTGRIGNDEKIIDIAKEMIRTGIKILPPRLSVSLPDTFAIDDESNALRFPYNAVKGVGKTSAHLAKIDNLHDVDTLSDHHLSLFKKTGKRAMEALALVGTFDHLFDDRNAAVEAVEYLSRGLPATKRKTLFAEEPKYSKADFWAIERELSGLYLSGSPLEGINPDQLSFGNRAAYQMMEGSMGLFVGVVKSARTHRDKSGGLMAFVIIEDSEYDEMSVIVFASLYSRMSEQFCIGCVVRVLGKVNVRYGKNDEEELKLQKYGRVSILAENIVRE